jgi:hypothetical protein
LSTEISENKQQVFQKQISWMMGIAQDHVNGSTEVIAENVDFQVDSTPFWAAISSKIPIYHSEWITALLDNAVVNPRKCHKLSATCEIFEHYRLQPFEGLVACGDYVKAENKLKIKNIVEQNGGRFEESFYGNSGVNLILADVEHSDEKMLQAAQVAKTFKMQIASTQWLAVSVAAKKPVKFYLRDKENDATNDDESDFALMLANIPHSTQIENSSMNQPIQLENAVPDDVEVPETEEAIAHEPRTPMEIENNDAADNLSVEDANSDHEDDKPPPAKRARKSIDVASNSAVANDVANADANDVAANRVGTSNRSRNKRVYYHQCP